VRDFAAKQGISEEEAILNGMQDLAIEIFNTASEI